MKNYIEENTVAATNQLNGYDNIFVYGATNPKTKILIVGNSITFHAPKPNIGWVNGWGMAASSAEKDYIHLLAGKLGERGDTALYAAQLSDWECSLNDGTQWTPPPFLRDLHPDVFVFRLGENIHIPENRPLFRKQLESFLSELTDEHTKKIFATCFWRHGWIDEEIAAYAKSANSAVVELGDLGDRAEMKAYGLFEHSGVASHPGDLGMSAIADRIYAEIQTALR